MLTTNELSRLREKVIETKNEESLVLLTEVESLNKEAWDYKNVVLRKLTTLEEDMNRLVTENARLLSLRDSAEVERDACVGLLVQLAVANGIKAGVKGNQVIVDLKSGQVSWEFAESESHLFENLPEYKNPVEVLEIGEKYRRVMNPSL